MFEQAGLSRQVLVVDLSSSSIEEGLIADTSQDAEFARQLFGDLNHDVLGPPDDDKVIILSDSDEEEEVREETAAIATDATSSTGKKSLAPTASAANADEDLGKMQDDNSDGLAPDQDIGNSSNDEDKASLP
jgi:hypothetical protein